MMTKKAHAYYRYSTKKQKDGHSETRQKEAIKEYCKTHGFELVDEYADLGVSGYKQWVKRHGLENLLQAIKDGTGPKAGEWVLIERLDRLSRLPISMSTQLINQILDAGVGVVAIHDQLTLTPDSKDRLIDVIKLAVVIDLAHQESAKRSTRLRAVAAARKEKVKAGIPTPRKLPFWLAYDKGEYRFSDKIDQLKRMVELRREGHGHRAIATMTNKEFGEDRSGNVVKGYLTNEALFGRFHFGESIDGVWKAKDFVDDYFPAVITQAEFRELNIVANAGGRGKAKGYHFSGLLKCSVCDGPLAMSRSNGYTFYRCCKAQDGRCDNKSPVSGVLEGVMQGIRFVEYAKPVQGQDISAIMTELERQNAIKNDIEVNILAGQAVGSLIGMLAKVDDKIRDLKKEISSAQMPTGDNEFKPLSSLVDNPAEFNRVLCEYLKEIKVYRISRNMARIKMLHHDGNITSVGWSRKNMFSEWKYSYSSTADIPE